MDRVSGKLVRENCLGKLSVVRAIARSKVFILHGKTFVRRESDPSSEYSLRNFEKIFLSSFLLDSEGIRGSLRQKHFFIFF